MLASSCCVSRVSGPQCRLPRPHQQRQPSRQARQPLRTLAFRGSSQPSNGSGGKLAATPDQGKSTKMVNLCLEYFNELMSAGNVEVAGRILDPEVAHKDMVRNEGRYGIQHYQQYVQELKKTYPQIYVKPTQFGVVDDHQMFVAFEGRATQHTPLFKGVDLFIFSQHNGATKIREVQVYRSNWLGAQGHEERKRQAQQEAAGRH